MREWIIQHKYLLILYILCILGLSVFTGHYAEILIDFGREVYYPEQILNGKILYKDLFNIYGPSAYQINAILFKIFGTKLSTLYAIGAICSLLFVNGIFLLANKFFSKILSFAIGIFTIAIGVTTVSIFNFHFPYSWAVLYGAIAFIYSLYYLIQYSQNGNSKNLYLSAFLAGFCISCKYDFLPYSLIIIFFIAKNKSIKALTSFLLTPLISYGILFLQGLNLNDLIKSLEIVKTMAKTKTLAYFYSNSGIFYHPLAIPTELLLFFKTALAITLISSGHFIKNKFASVLATLVGCIITFFIVGGDIQRIFGFLPMFLLIATIATYKLLSTQTRILVISTILVCTKVFWAILIGSYGSFYISIALIAGLVIALSFLPKNIEKYLTTFVLLISTILFLHNFNGLLETQSKIKTDKGTIYTRESLGKSTQNLVNFINNNTTLTDKIVIAPEGMTINFLTNREYDDFYNSLLPLYFETFNEKPIIEHYKKIKPEYIILTNHNTRDYYFEYICEDYAFEFCQFIQENYKLQDVIDNDYRFIIFKLST